MKKSEVIMFVVKLYLSVETVILQTVKQLEICYIVKEAAILAVEI
jgi:hypothetical protein